MRLLVGRATVARITICACLGALASVPTELREPVFTEAAPAADDSGPPGESRSPELRGRRSLRERTDSLGRARPDLWKRGTHQVQQMEVAAGAAAPQWVQIGPAPLRVNGLDFFQGVGPNSGTILDIAIDPSGTTDQIIYIATLDGGIWKSTDGGLSWNPKTDLMPSLEMGAVALDPADPSIVYAGTGHVFSSLFAVGEAFSNRVGIYKSADGADTWSVLNPGGLFSNAGIGRIVLPAPDMLLVATDQGLFRSIDGGLQFGSNAPSFDNGQPVLDGVISDLDLGTETPTTVYASVAGTGIFRSTDGGATFPTNLFGNPGAPLPPYDFIAFAQSTQPDHLRMYATVGGASAWQFAGLFRSDDAGAHWTLKPAAATPGKSCQCGYDQTIGVDPQDPDQVYIGFQRLWQSTDGGATFDSSVTFNMMQIHVDHHALAFAPAAHVRGGAPTRFYVGTDGGISRTDDGGLTWINLNEGIATNLFFAIDIGRGSAFNNGFTYGSTMDTGTIEHRPDMTGTDWYYGIGGDTTGETAVDPCNPSHAFAAAQWQYVSTTDGGAHWSVGTSGLPQYILHVAADPNCGVRYATLTTQLFQSTDDGATFGLMHTFPGSIEAIATVKLDSNIMWLGLDDGTVQRTENALDGVASSWTPIVIGAPNQPVSSLAIDPLNPNEVVVAYPGFCGATCAPGNRTRHVFRTSNNGITWSDISGTDGGDPAQNLPDLPLHSVVIDPGTSPHTIIVASDAGVMQTTDLGATWQVLGAGLPTVLSTSLALDWHAAPPLLRVGTYGRSAWQLTTTIGETPACNRARIIPPDGGVFWGTTSGKSTLGGSCGGTGPETVFQWTPRASGEATIETCGTATTYDTVLYLRRRFCLNGDEVACDDDGCANRASRITARVVGGDTYFIVVDSYAGGGPFTLSVVPPPAPPTPTRTPTATPSPVPCDRATTIPATGGVFTGTTAGLDTLAGTCGQPGSPEVVFQWTPATSGLATIETCGSGTDYDTVLYARTGSCTNGSEVACDDDSCLDSTGHNVASRITAMVSAGVTYFIIVDGSHGASGSFTLSVTAPQPSPTATATPSPTSTRTRTSSPTATRTWSLTTTPTRTATPTVSRTPSRTPTPTRSGTPTLTRTPTRTHSPTTTPTATPTPWPTHVVTGHVRYYSNDLPVEGAEVYASGGTSDVVNTDAGGAFAINGRDHTNCTLEPRSDGKADAGVSALDAVFVLQHAVGLRQLDSDQQLACDTNGNGIISALDAVFILQYAVGLIQSFPVAATCGSDWAFVPVPAPTPNQQLIQPQMTAGSCQPGAIVLSPLVGGADNQDFSAVLFGDCTGNWHPSAAGVAAASEPSASSTPRVRLGVARRGQSGRVRFPLFVDSPEPLHALEARISYDPLTLRLLGVRPADAARHALLQYNSKVTGMARLALASAEPIAHGSAPVLTLDFARRTSGRMTPPRVRSASVEGRSAVAGN